MMKGGLGNIMKQAQQLQDRLQKTQEELAHIEVQGHAGGMNTFSLRISGAGSRTTSANVRDSGISSGRTG